MAISPGIYFIGRSLAHVFLSCLVTFAILFSISDQLGIISKSSLFLLSIALYLLGVFVAKPLVDDYRSSITAKALGAKLPPHINLGAVKVLEKIRENFETGYPAEHFNEWTRIYGQTFRYTIGTEEQFFTTEPHYVKAILGVEFGAFEKGPVVFSQLESLLGVGVINSDGETWKFHCSITRPYFSRERISDFDVFDRHADDAMRQAKLRLAEGYPIDFQDLVARFTLDSATEYLFGKDVHSQSAGLAYPDPPSFLSNANSSVFENHPSNTFVKALLQGQMVVTLRSKIGGFWPLTEIWGDGVAPFRRDLDQFVEPLIQDAINRKQRKEDVDERETLLDFLVDQTTDMKMIKDELINLLVASRDTTASLLTFSLYMLIEYPEVCRRLREEILSGIGAKSRPSYEDIRSMKYLRAFLNEVLRLYPPVPINSRTATKSVLLSSPDRTETPIFVPAHRRVVYSVFLMHRRTDLWGPDALEFDPERFLDERAVKYLMNHPFIFAPFNAGPRICIGKQFAYNEVSFFVIRLLQRFSSFSLALDAQAPDSLPPAQWMGKRGPQGRDKVCIKTHLTMHVKGGLWVRMEDIDE